MFQYTYYLPMHILNESKPKTSCVLSNKRVAVYNAQSYLNKSIKQYYLKILIREKKY